MMSLEDAKERLSCRFEALEDYIKLVYISEDLLDFFNLRPVSEYLAQQYWPELAYYTDDDYSFEGLSIDELRMDELQGMSFALFDILSYEDALKECSRHRRNAANIVANFDRFKPSMMQKYRELMGVIIYDVKNQYAQANSGAQRVRKPINKKATSNN